MRYNTHGTSAPFRSHFPTLNYVAGSNWTYNMVAQVAGNSANISSEIKIVATPRSFADRLVCLFSAHTSDGKIQSYVRYHLSQLSRLGFDVILVLSVDRIPNRSWQKQAEGLAGVVVRRSAGSAFSAWADAFASLPTLWAARAVLLVTDEVFGPVRNLNEVVDRVLASPAAFIGMTERTFQASRHLQPYFIMMKRNVLANGRIREFWSTVVDVDQGAFGSALSMIRLMKTTRILNIATQALFPHPGGASNTSDPMLTFWRELVDQGCPYLKVDLLRGQPAAVLGRPGLIDGVLATAVNDLLESLGSPVGKLAAPVNPEAPADEGAATKFGASRSESVYRQYRDQTLQKDQNKTHFAPLSRRPVSAERCDVKLIAYYLPQFHPIPENDAWWGRGFTEWTNVAKATPAFVGHYQPQLPGELGFYDLRVIETMARQVELAKQYGIWAFCFYFYWFDGHTLLERPLKSYLAATDLNLPFCLCWANENWTRRWDGRESEVLIRQVHSAEDDIAFIRHLGRYLTDSRYLTIDGMPVLTVYRPELLPDPSATAARWRTEARKMGLPGLFLVAADAFGFSDYKRHGFDALSEFPPHSSKARGMNESLAFVAEDFTGQVLNYADVATHRVAPQSVGKVWPGVFPSWDNTPRQPVRGTVFHGSTPRLFRTWLDDAIERSRANPERERFVLINAWNEWAEGAHLEPDRRFGYAYLAACRSAIADHSVNDSDVCSLFAERRTAFRAANSRAVVLHVTGTGVEAEVAQAVEKFGEVDIYLTLVRHVSLKHAQQMVEAFPSAYIQEVDDRGRDMLALRAIFGALQQGNYAFVGKLICDDTAGREAQTAALLSSDVRVELDRISGNEKIGLLMVDRPLKHATSTSQTPSSIDHMKDIAARLGLSETPEPSVVGDAGFWFRPAALSAFVEAISFDDFEPELDQLDGVFSCALERMVAAAVRAAGFKVAHMKR